MNEVFGGHPQRSHSLAVAMALVALTLVVVVDAALIPLARDSSVFMFIGERILHGSIPYIDIWDHKPPAVFYIDALGLALLGETGVRVLEFVSLTAAALFSFRGMTPALGRPLALLATAYWLVNAPLVFEGGNLPEEFGLLIQFAALFVLCGWRPARLKNARWFTLGCLTAAAILLKPTLVGVFLAGFPFLVIHLARTKNIRVMARATSAYTFGLFVVIAIVMAYFWSQSALAALADEVLVYNFWYSHFVGWSDRLGAVRMGFVVLSRSGLAPIGIVSAITGTLVVLVRRSCSAEVRRIVTFSAVWLMAEVALSSTTGRSYAHYYISWLPPLALSAGGLAALLLNPRGSTWQRTFARLLPAAVLIAGSLVPTARVLRDAAAPPGDVAMSRAAAAQYVSTQTQSQDTVLVWGAEAIVNLESGRASPTRFAYLYPLFTRGYQTQKLTETFLNGLRSSPPALIIDASAEVANFVSPLDPAGRAGWQSPDPTYAKPPGLESVFSFIDSNYRLEDFVGPRRWPIYRYWPH